MSAETTEIIGLGVTVWLFCSLAAFWKYSAFYKRKGWPPFSSRPLLVVVGMCWAGPVSLLLALTEVVDGNIVKAG